MVQVEAYISFFSHKYLSLVKNECQIMTKRLFIFFILIFAGFGLHSQDDSTAVNQKSPKKNQEEPKPPALGEVFKPTLGIGTGMLSYYGDLYSKHAQAPWTARTAYEVILTQPLSKSFYLDFYGMFGKLGANEHLDNRNENFQSEIRMGGVHLTYDFSNFINPKNKVRPWISTGFESFEFLSKTDLYDKNGNKYYYWSDGSIKNMAEGSPGSQNAIDLVRDYSYESDIRELNKDGFGKYRESSWAVPVGAGITMHLNNRFDFKVGTTFHFTFTDYLDGVTNKSTGNRIGNKAKDNFVMTSFSLHYDLVTRKKDDTLSSDYFNDVDFYALDLEDEDGDGVKDFDDACHKTPKGVQVDEKGCPVDEDKDLTADYRDDELPTPGTMIANTKGVGITDAMAQLWYDTYYDSTGIFAKRVDLDSAGKEPKVNPASQKKEYTVELAKFKGGVPSDVMAYLLSIGDIRSTTIGDTVVIYTAGSYEDINIAIQRKDEFIAEGVKDAKVGMFKGQNYKSLTKEEFEKELELAKGKAPVNPGTTPVSTAGNVIYRVQLGAYKNQLSPSVFKNIGKVIELKTGDGYYKYVTDAYKSLNDAAARRADLVLEGYPDAFISAYKDGKRIPLTEAGATFENKDDGKNENLNEAQNTGSAIDKSLVKFHVQLGVVRKADDPGFAEKIKTLKDVQRQGTVTGLTRFFVGNFGGYNEAVKFKNELVEKGFGDAFVIATFKGELISIQEALELLK